MRFWRFWYDKDGKLVRYGLGVIKAVSCDKEGKWLTNECNRIAKKLYPKKAGKEHENNPPRH